MKSIDSFNFANQKALIRVDYNVPLDDNFNVTDVTRIVRTKETVSKILNDGGTIILMSHLGRPKGEANNKYSLRHIVGKVSEILGQEVVFAGDVLDPKTADVIAGLKPGSIALLENLRFHAEEEKGDPDFAKAIARLGGKAFAGYLLYNEVMSLEKVLNGPERPFTAIIGGSKVSTKINIITNLLPKVDNLIVGGGLSYTFLAAMGYTIGKSLFEPDMLPVAKEILDQVKKSGKNFYCRLDTICGDKFGDDANILITEDNNIPDNWEGLDIGPKTQASFAKVLKESKTILWNGPVGVFELEKFSKGTKAVAISVAAATLAGAYSVIGGGDSIAAINKYDLGDYVSYISTGGGAMLEYLEGKVLPGVQALNEN